MAHLTPREIKAEIDRLSKRLRVAENAITITNGVPTVQGTESDGQLAYDQLGHNLYVFDRGSYVIAVESIFFMYATAVDFTGETTADTMAGRVTSQGDVTGFTASPFTAAGVQHSFRGTFFGIEASTNPIDYEWNEAGEGPAGADGTNGTDGTNGNSVVLERSYTTTAGLLTEIGDPTTPGSGVTWISVESPFTVPATAFFVADRFTIGTAVSAWQISPVQAKDGGLPFVTHTEAGSNMPTLGDSAWIIDAVAAVSAFTGRAYTNQKEFGYGTVVVITYDDGKLPGKFTRSGSNDTWVAATEFIDGDLLVDGTIAADKIQANAITAGKIAANAITADKIEANAITAGKIAAGSISADRLDFTPGGGGGGGGAEQWDQAMGTAGDYDIGTSVFNNGNFYVSTVDNNATQPPSSTWTAIVGGDSNSTASRLTITSERIDIYEGNVLRVRLGNLD